MKLNLKNTTKTVKKDTSEITSEIKSTSLKLKLSPDKTYDLDELIESVRRDTTSSSILVQVDYSSNNSKSILYVIAQNVLKQNGIECDASNFKTQIQLLPDFVNLYEKAVKQFYPLYTSSVNNLLEGNISISTVIEKVSASMSDYYNGLSNKEFISDALKFDFSNNKPEIIINEGSQYTSDIDDTTILDSVNANKINAIEKLMINGTDINDIISNSTNTETERATNAESELLTKINDEAEKARANENLIVDQVNEYINENDETIEKINDKISSNTTSIQTLANKLNASDYTTTEALTKETERATSAESKLLTKINDEISRAKETESHISQVSATSIGVIQSADDTHKVILNLLNENDEVLNSQVIDLDSTHTLDTAVLNYDAKKVVLTFKDGHTYDCDISELINYVSEVKYSELVELRNNSKLIPGKWYRIIDYNTTTSYVESQSAKHQFDIIVNATSTNTLNEEAFAAQHDGDTYFSNSKLDAWKIWYCLDNDTSRFNWAGSSDGTGVIYRMIDEFDNDIPYDFKNIQFKRYKITAVTNSVNAGIVGNYVGFNGTEYACTPYGVTQDLNDYIWCYTFPYFKTDSTDTAIVAHNNELYFDCSLYQDATGYGTVKPIHVRSVIIKPCMSDTPIYRGVQMLNNIVFITSDDTDEWIIGTASHHNTIGKWNSETGSEIGINIAENCFRANILFGRMCQNTLGSSFEYNTIGNTGENSNNMSWCDIANHFQNNCVGDGFCHNTIDSLITNNIIGDACAYNTFEFYFINNRIGNNFTVNNISKFFQNNTIGDEFLSNAVGIRFAYNTIGNSFKYNTVGNVFAYNTVSTNCVSNNLANYVGYNTIGSSFQFNTIYNYFVRNTVGDSVNTNVVCDRTSDSIFPNHFRMNNITTKLVYVNLTVTNNNTDSTDAIVNTTISSIPQGTSSNLVTFSDAAFLLRQPVNNVITIEMTSDKKIICHWIDENLYDHGYYKNSITDIAWTEYNTSVDNRIITDDEYNDIMEDWDV